MFGISSFIFSFLFFITGITYFVGASSKKLIDKWFWGIYLMILISVFMSFNFKNKLLGGSIGFEVVDYTISFFGKIGVISFLTFGFSYLFVIYFNLKPENIYNKIKKYLFLNRKKKDIVKKENSLEDNIEKVNIDVQSNNENKQDIGVNINKDIKPTIENFSSSII